MKFRTRLILNTVLTSAALALGIAGWLGGSESGLGLLAHVVTSLTGNRLVLERPAGRLIGPLHIDHLRWHDASTGLDVRAENIELDWRPQALLGGRLDIANLGIAQIQVDTGSSDTPAPLPESIAPPLPVRIDELRIDRLDIEGLPISPTGIAASLSAERSHYQLAELSGNIGDTRLLAKGTIATRAPLELALSASLEGQVRHAFKLQIDAMGTLAEPAAKLVASGAINGQGSITLTPFAPQPIRAATLQLAGVDPADWQSGAPSARLSIDLDLQPSGDKCYRGVGRLRNATPGRIDQGALPLRQFDFVVDGQADAFELSRWSAELPTGGRVFGTGRFAHKALTLAAKAEGMDLAAVHQDFRPTRLAGEIDANLARGDARFSLQLADRNYSITTAGSYQEDRLSISRLTLLAGKALLSANGTLALVGKRQFTVQGSLQHFDPSRFARLPSADVNARFNADGQLAPSFATLAVNARLALDESRIGRTPLAGTASGRLDAERLHDITIDLRAGDNRLKAIGNLGSQGDTLNVSLTAPRLEQLGAGGSITGKARVGGTLRNPQIRLQLASPAVHLPAGVRLEALAVQAELGDRDDSRLHLDASFKRLQPGRQGTALGPLRIAADGVRGRHTASVEFDAGNRRLQFDLAGALARDWHWQGQLMRLIASAQQTEIRLAAPAGLQVASDSLRLQDARLQQWHAGSAAGTIALESLQASPGKFESRGNIEALSLQGVSPIGAPSLSGIALDGRWQLALGDTARGDFHFAGQRGNPRGKTQGSGQPAIETLRLDGDIHDRRLHLSVALGGKAIGQASGELTLPIERGALGWGLARTQPMSGQAKFDIDKLAWLPALLHQDVVADGTLRGDLSASGTPARPQLNGKLQGRDLSVLLPALGLHLDTGVLDVRFEGSRIAIRQFEFASRNLQQPRDKRIDTKALMATPGKLRITGELDPFSSNGALEAGIDRVALLQRQERWLLISGDARFGLQEQRLRIDGKLVADAAYFELPPAETPKLGNDVSVRGRETTDDSPLHMDVDLSLLLGNAVYFNGAGVNSRLAGDLRVRSTERGVPRATGSIRTMNGVFEAYGTQLSIERGILNFQGLADNPGLNVLAMRRNQSVDAGVTVSGTLQKPVVKLVSEPSVPDTEKLMWMVLGHGPDNNGGTGGAEAALLLSAASGMFGDSNFTRNLRRGFGIDEFSVHSGNLDGSGAGRTSRVASTQGFGSGSAQNGQVLSVGKRLADNVTLAYEESLSSTGSIVKLTVQLTRRLALIGRAGDDNALDLFYSFSFGR